MNTFMCDLLVDMDYIAMNHVHLIDRMLPPNMRGDERGEYDLYTLFSNKSNINNGSSLYFEAIYFSY